MLGGRVVTWYPPQTDCGLLSHDLDFVLLVASEWRFSVAKTQVPLKKKTNNMQKQTQYITHSCKVSHTFTLINVHGRAVILYINNVASK